MYIQKVVIENIRAIEHLELNFKDGQEAGWHVLIGDNGSGKTTIIDLLTDTVFGIYNFTTPHSETLYKIAPNDTFNNNRPCFTFTFIDEKNSYYVIREFKGEGLSQLEVGERTEIYTTEFQNNTFSIYALIEQKNNNSQLNDLRKSLNVIGYGVNRDTQGFRTSIKEMSILESTFITLIFPSYSLIDSFEWLQQQEYRHYKLGTTFKSLDYIKMIINQDDLLPGCKFSKLNPDGLPEFVFSNDQPLNISLLSQGYRSILSLAFDILYQLIKRYGEDAVFADFIANKDNPIIALPGVVLIDEVDAHLHPTWQVRIGEWFTKTFPKIQFIVTTHSPLICRACGETGTIWQLAAPGSGEQSREITGDDRNRLVYGDVLDAYGTRLFGAGIDESKIASDMKQRLAEYSLKKTFDVTLTPEEEADYQKLNAIFATHA